MAHILRLLTETSPSKVAIEAKVVCPANEAEPVALRLVMSPLLKLLALMELCVILPKLKDGSLPALVPIDTRSTN